MHSNCYSREARRLLLRLLPLLLLACPAARAAFCSGKPNPAAQPNLHALDTRAPVLVRSVPNASLYHVGCPGQDCLSVVHLWGTPYAKVRLSTTQTTLHALYAESTDRAMLEPVLCLLCVCGFGMAVLLWFPFFRGAGLCCFVCVCVCVCVYWLWDTYCVLAGFWLFL